MRKMLFVVTAILLLTLSSMVFAQSSSEFRITVSDNKGSAPQVMVFGNHLNGTYGVGGEKDSLNPTLIERESPPPTPGLFIVWKPSRSGVNWGNGFLTYDFKGYTDSAQKDTFKLSFAQNEFSDADITLTWGELSHLEARATAMTVRAGAETFDMFTQSSVTLPAANDNGIFFVTIIKTGCNIIDNVKLENPTVPGNYRLNQNFPNPFNPSTTITFDVLKSSNVEISVYNVLGQKVSTLVSRDLNPGSYSTNWSASSFSSGVYYVRMSVKENGVEQYSSLRKLLFVK